MLYARVVYKHDKRKTVYLCRLTRLSDDKVVWEIVGSRYRSHRFYAKSALVQNDYQYLLYFSFRKVETTYVDIGNFVKNGYIDSFPFEDKDLSKLAVKKTKRKETFMKYMGF